MLFDENVGFISFDLYKKDDKKPECHNLLNTDEGFLKGNMFIDEYIPYKNYNYKKLTPTTKKEQLLFEIMELSFAINDINLKLDLNPKDEFLNNSFKRLVDKSCKKESEYVCTYGPLEVIDSESNTFDWINSPWPWNEQADGEKYV
ncbi:MAG: spore coat protein CotJB [Bacilli bacterium]